jgi:hypothetical protein
MGRFVEARAAARRALNLDARDRQSRDRLVQINEVLALDPSQRRLTDAERFRRAQLLLRRVHQDLMSCIAIAAPGVATASGPAAPPSPAQAADLAAALSTAEILLEDEDALAPPVSRPADVRKADVQKPTVSPSPSATPGPTLQERIDARLAAAEALWDARIARCGAVDGPLAWIFDRVAP